MDGGPAPLRAFLGAALCVLLAGVSVHAAPGEAPPHTQVADSVCFGGKEPGSTVRIGLPAHYVIELVRNPDSLAYESACRAEVKDPSGTVRWSEVGFSAMLDGWTGHDVDGDGRPDAVVGVDVGGGNRCCWTNTILALDSSARVLAHLDFRPIFALDSLGRTVLYETVAFYGVGPTEAESPVLTRVRQFRAGKLELVTSEYCPGLLTDTVPRNGRPSPLSHPTSEARAASRATTGEPPYEVERTRVDVMSLALQELECGRSEAAARLVRETWPSAQARAQLARIEAAWRRRSPI